MLKPKFTKKERAIMDELACEIVDLIRENLPEDMQAVGLTGHCKTDKEIDKYYAEMNRLIKQRA